MDRGEMSQEPTENEGGERFSMNKVLIQYV